MSGGTALGWTAGTWIWMPGVPGKRTLYDPDVAIGCGLGRERPPPNHHPDPHRTSSGCTFHEAGACSVLGTFCDNGAVSSPERRRGGTSWCSMDVLR